MCTDYCIKDKRVFVLEIVRKECVVSFDLAVTCITVTAHACSTSACNSGIFGMLHEGALLGGGRALGHKLTYYSINATCQIHLSNVLTEMTIMEIPDMLLVDKSDTDFFEVYRVFFRIAESSV